VGSYQGASMFQHAPLMIRGSAGCSTRTAELLGDDWWPYGFAANRTAIDTFLRYHYEQGLSKRRLEPEEIFVPELLAT